ncbi:FeoB-associated Cys-rich membrane protein [Sinanaerobacter chloroacetimidivorans]|uniref:FeoB-associated Cys-rich membrane protein n=1 Tax=Sinanaerobacter chloroacetimidivorans TaxID=2818044 RepID=A0A8J7W0T8_9FIRM|nr:FeoB-associated Cys-rich membrane protein [Sinanaerobacter chloroacetimidivorans]MBR0598294.1 FeoB-associated Cys-rich membrane protein [Sinanaerobacter chloroacetimidivorans]
MVDFIIGGLVLIAVIFAVRQVIKNQKNGGCAGGCSGCSQGSSCRVYEDLEKEIQEKNKGK